jgi:hypothetical protein
MNLKCEQRPTIARGAPGERERTSVKNGREHQQACDEEESTLEAARPILDSADHGKGLFAGKFTRHI